MLPIKFSEGQLPLQHQQALDAGFAAYSASNSAPQYQKTSLNWSIVDTNNKLIGVVTANLLWDWIYIDELWIDQQHRGSGLGKKLMIAVEKYAIEHSITGVWLWTQSWQAPDFYRSLGFVEFTRFDNFPQGHSRIGFRKHLLNESV